MQIKLYILLPHPQAERIVAEGFEESTRSYRLSPAEYTACSAFNPQSLIEIVLELERATLNRYRQELEQPVDDEFAADDEFGATVVEPIHWYELPAKVLRKTCRSCRIINSRGN